MSTAFAARQAAPAPGRPGYWRVFRAAAFGQFCGALALLGVGMVLSLTSLVGLSSGGEMVMYAPWTIDGPWAALADIGWGLLVVALVAALIRERLQAFAGGELSRALMLATVALAGYLPWLLTRSAEGRLGISLLLMPALARPALFDAAGRARRLPRALELPALRQAALVGASALALVAPFALLHPLSVHGSGQGGGTFERSAGGFVHAVRPGRVVAASVGLQSGLFPLHLTGVHILSSSRALRVLRLTRGSTPPLMRSAPPRGLAFNVAARSAFWIGFAIELTRCPPQPVAVGAIRLSYTELGLPLSQTVSLAGNDTLLRCP